MDNVKIDVLMRVDECADWGNSSEEFKRTVEVRRSDLVFHEISWIWSSFLEPYLPLPIIFVVLDYILTVDLNCLSHLNWEKDNFYRTRRCYVTDVLRYHF
jgi:hypothetical protein